MPDLEIVQVEAGIFPITRYGEGLKVVVLRVRDYLHFTIHQEDDEDVISAIGRTENEYDVRINAARFREMVETLTSGLGTEYSSGPEGVFRLESGEGDEQLVLFEPPCGDQGALVKLSVLKEIAVKFEEPAIAANKGGDA